MPKRKASRVSMPVCLVVLEPDGDPGNDISQDTPPFKLCHGAQHRLEVNAPDGSTWAGQKLSLHWMGADGDLPARYGLNATPPFVTKNLDDEANYQPLAADGANWRLTSEITDSVESGDVALGLGSYWQALKYPIAAQVGDFWYSITELEWDSSVPVVEGSRPVTLTATVHSAFNEERLIQGAKVTWTVGNQTPTVIETDANGQSKFQFILLENDIVDDHVTITAACEDAFEHKLSSVRTLRAFVQAPWLDQLTIVLRKKDGPPVEETALGKRVVRGGAYELVLAMKDGESDYFLDHMISLDWFEDSKDLGIDFFPEGARKMPAEGLSWDITGGDESGEFRLQVWSQALGEGVPFPVKGVQLSANLIDEVDVKIDEDSLTSPLIFRRGTGRKIKVTPKSGSPLARMKENCRMTLVDGSQVPSDKMTADPAFDVAKEMTASGLEWTVTGVEVSGTFGLDVHMVGYTGFTLRDGVLLSQNLLDEVDVTVDDKAPTNPLVFRRGTGRTIKVKPKSGSPLLLNNGDCSMSYWGESQVPSGKVMANPVFGDKNPMVASGLEWMVTGVEVSGTFRLDVHMVGYTGFTLQDGVLLSQNLLDEVDVTVDDKAPTNPLVFRRGTGRTIKVKPKSGSPLLLNNGDCSMSYWGESLVPSGKVTASPVFGDKNPMVASGLEWTVTGVEVSGTFGLNVHMVGYTGFTFLDGVLLSQNLLDEVEVTIDGKALTGPLVFHRGTGRTIKVRPKSGSPLLLNNGGCSMSYWGESQVPSGKVTASPVFGHKTPMVAKGLEWTVTGVEVSGTFGLNVHMEGYSGFTLRDGVLLSQNLLDEVEVTIDGKALTGPLVFHRGTGRTIKVRPKSGSPLLLNNGGCSMSYWGESQVPSGKVTASPVFGHKTPMVAKGLEWTVTGVEVSGTFGLNVHMEGYSGFTLRDGVLLSQSLIDEVDVTINGGGVRIPMILRLSSTNKMKLVPKSGSPLARVPGKYKMTFTEGSLTARDMRVAPPFNEEHELNGGKLEWKIDQLSVQGMCSLNLHMTEFADEDKIVIQTTVLSTSKDEINEASNTLLGNRQ